MCTKKDAVKSAPEVDTAKVMWRSHAGIIMRNKGIQIEDKDIKLGRLSLSDNETFPKIGGYVLFYAFVGRADVPETLLEKIPKNENDLLVVVKFYKSKSGKLREPIVIPAETLQDAKEYAPNCTFRAVVNTEWAYIQRGDDAEVLLEYDYRAEKRNRA